MVTTIDGSARKSLSEQIDRLDSILDGLADGLNGAVADAVRKAVGLAVQEAVKAVLTEVLTNPAVLEKLRSATPPAPKPAGAVGLLARVNAWASAGWTKLREACSAAWRGVAQAPNAARHGGRLLWALRTPLLLAVSAGIVSGTAAFMAGPWIAATAGSVAGFTAGASAQLAISLRRMLSQLTSCAASPR